MSLTTFRTLGRSGLIVSPLALGTMTFGTPRLSRNRIFLHKGFEGWKGCIEKI